LTPKEKVCKSKKGNNKKSLALRNFLICIHHLITNYSLPFTSYILTVALVRPEEYNCIREEGNMKKSPNLKLYLIISLLGLGFIVASAILIAKSQAYKNNSSILGELKEQNRTLQEKLNELELAYSQLKDKNKQLKSDMDDFIKLQALSDKNQEFTPQSREILAQKEKEYNSLKEQYALLSDAYNDLIREELAAPAQQQGEVTGRRQRPTQEQIDQMRTTMRDRTSQALDSRITEAKTEYEAGLLTDIKQVYDDMYQLQEKIRTATDEERTAIRDEMTQQRRTLRQLYQDYNTYQWESFGKEFGVTNTDEFIKRAQELSQTNSPFGFFGGRGGSQRQEGQQGQ
jgi:hypothetical protein